MVRVGNFHREVDAFLGLEHLAHELLGGLSVRPENVAQRTPEVLADSSTVHRGERLVDPDKPQIRAQKGDAERKRGIDRPHLRSHQLALLALVARERRGGTLRRDFDYRSADAFGTSVGSDNGKVVRNPAPLLTESGRRLATDLHVIQRFAAAHHGL